MGKGKVLTAAEKQKITKLLGEGMFILEISKECYRDHLMINWAVENITKFRFGLVSLFNGISTFVGYLIPKQFS